MKRTHKICLCLLLFLLAPSFVLSQEKEVIGLDAATGTQYSCVRFLEKSLNGVEIVNGKNGKVKLFKIKSAKRKISKVIRVANKRRKAVRKLLNIAQKKLKNVGIDGVALNNAQIKKLKKFQAQVAKLDQKLSSIQVRIGSLKELRLRVDECKDPKVLNGSLEVVSTVYVDPSSPNVPLFLAAIIYNVPSNSGNLCALVDGHKESLPIGFGGVYYPLPPWVNFLSVTGGSICGQSDIAESCVAFAEGAAVGFASIRGRNEPGTCPQSQSHVCSLSDAVSILNQRMGQIIVNVLDEGRAACSQDLSDY